MKRKDMYIMFAVLCLCFLAVFWQPLVQATTVSVEGFLGTVIDKINGALKVSLVSTSDNLSVDGTLTVDGASTLTGNVSAGADVAVTGNLDTSAWRTMNIVTTTAQSYSLASAGKAGGVIQTAGEAASLHLMTDLLTEPGDGGYFFIKTGDANNVVIDTEGSETIDGAATYTIDGTLESVLIATDGTNFHILGSYLE